MRYLRTNWTREGFVRLPSLLCPSKGLQTNTQDIILSVGLHVPKWMEQSPSWKSERSSSSKRIPHAVWISQVHCRFRKNPPLAHILSQINPVHALASCFCKLDFHILPSTPWSSNRSVYFKFSHQNPMCISVFSYTCHMPSPAHLRCSYGRDEFISHIRENIRTESVGK